MLSLNPKDIPPRQLHHYLLGAVVPRPICFASTVDENGNSNLAPFSFFNVFSPRYCIDSCINSTPIYKNIPIL